MRQGYFSFHLEASSVDDLGRSCFKVSDLALPLPFFLAFEDLSIMIDWMVWTSKVLLGFDEFSEGLLEPVSETYFFFEEVLMEVWDTNPIIPSISGTSRDLEDIRYEDGVGASSNISYSMVDCE